MRPLGLLLLTTFLLIQGIAGILTGFGMIFAKDEIYEDMKREFKKVLEDLNATQLIDAEEIFSTIYEFTSLALISIGLLYIITASGILMLKKWARILSIFLLVLQFIYSLIMIYVDPLSIFGVLLSFFFIWYLLRRDVQEKFSGRKTSIEEKILGKKI
ncbi:MAG: hypothetical protein RMH75_04870 [Archaeoglobaceae archaeon]|nr:hypothetical protein [Archaeoglobaceae archaeon]MDW7989977.1 hypothetical protein [Archaeoglobaceae archaeon]